MRNRAGHDKSAMIAGVCMALWCASVPALAQTESVPPLPNNLPEPTPKAEVILANPIKLQISQYSPSADLPLISGSLTITQAVETALKNNLTYRQSSYDVQIAKSRARKELGRFGPTISFNPFFSVSSLNQMLINPISEGFGAGWPMQPINKGTLFSGIFAGTQPLFAGGYLVGNYRAARAQAKQSLSGYQMERIAAALRAKQAYWTVVFNESKLRVDTDYVKLKEQSAANMKARWQVGKVPRADYLREEAEVARARTQVNQDYRDYNVALVNLKVEMGVNLTSLIEATDALQQPGALADTMDSYLQQAGTSRPEIAQANGKIEEMKGRQMVARSQYMPHVNAYGAASNVSGDSPDGRASGKWGGFIGVIGHITLFDTAQGVNDIRGANAAFRQAVVARQQVQQKVAQDVATAWIERETARRNVELATAQITSAEEDYRLLHARYLVGKAIPLEEFDAAVRLFKARLELVEATYNYQLAQDKLVAASGAV